ncbi:peptidylprolyl isomerase [Clostridium sp.]|uniref:peptidylprolyl isomerase n=1 Tax=Clostridium sp. TaxID=1506 RepID=UPI0026182EE9|nr:peptidylprolyl isomerase [Clostridium sp.]
MTKIKKILAAGALSIFAFSAVGCNMIEKTPEAIKNTVLAKVSGEKITKGEVDEIADPYLLQYGEDYATNTELADTVKQTKIQALNLLVEEKMMNLKAEELGVVPNQEEIDAEVNKYLEGMKTNYGGEEGLNAALEQAGLKLEGYTESLIKSIKSQLTRNNVIEDLFKDIATEDEEIKTYFDENKESFVTGTVSHILITDEAKAKEIRERATAGEDFAELAKEYSEDPGTKEAGGSLGTVAYNSTKYMAEFMDGVRATKNNEISEPVKSSYGYHIIKVTDYKEENLESSKESIKTTLENQKKNDLYNEKIEQWKKDYNVKTYEDKL